MPPPVDVPLWEARRAIALTAAEVDLSVLRQEAVDEWHAALERLASGRIVPEAAGVEPWSE